MHNSTEAKTTIINIAEENTSGSILRQQKGKHRMTILQKPTEHLKFIKTTIIYIAEENISDQYLGNKKGNTETPRMNVYMLF